MSFYDNIENFTYALLQQYGREIFIITEIDPALDYITGDSDSTVIKYSAWGVQSDFSELFQGGLTPIQKGDRLFILTTRNGKPSLGDMLMADDELHSIVNVSSVSPAGGDIIYKIRARTYAKSDLVDTLTVKMGDLTPGSIIADTSRDDLQSWRVVAHNHYTAGYTTLLLDGLFNKELQAFTGLGGYPTKPWIQTWMRRYLLSTFKSTLSPNLIAQIQEVEIVTNNLTTSDTIFLLSREELGGGTVLQYDNTYEGGDKMDYFNIPSKRIATYNNTNTTYWTRDVWGVNSAGDFATVNPAYTYGVRPALNVKSSLLTALNLNGQYEILW